MIIATLKSTLAIKMEEGSSPQDHFTEFQNQWARLTSTVSNTKTPLGTALKNIAESSEAKAAFLLASLPASFDNIIDNLQSQNLTSFEYVHSRQLDMSANKEARASTDKAYQTRSSATKKGKKSEKEGT